MNKSSSGAMVKETLKRLRGSSARERLLHRLHSVALVLNGLSSSEAARIYGDSPRAVAYWVKRFKQHGVSGLREEARPGRPSRVKPSHLQRVQTFIGRSRAASKPINADSVSAFLLKACGISLTHRQCWRVLKKLRT